MESGIKCQGVEVATLLFENNEERGTLATGNMLENEYVIRYDQEFNALIFYPIYLVSMVRIMNCLHNARTSLYLQITMLQRY